MRFIYLFEYSIFYLVATILGLFSFILNDSLFGGGAMGEGIGGLYNSIIVITSILMLAITICGTLLNIKNADFPPSIYAMFALLVVFIVFNMLFYMNSASLKDLIKSILYPSLMPMTIIYAYTAQKKSDYFCKVGVIVSFVFFLLCTFIFFVKFNDVWGREEQISIFLIVALLPMICFIKFSILRYVILAVSMVILILSAKRGAMLSAAVGITLYLFFENVVLSRRFRMLFIVSFPILFCAFAYLSYRAYLSMGGFLNERFQDISEGGSGRLDIWLTTIAAFKRLPTFDKMVGTGFYGTLKDIGIWAHNDFLEVLYSYGIIGIVFYIIFWFAIVIPGVKMLRCRFPEFSIYVLAVSILFILSMISMVIDSPNCIIFLFASIGIIWANWRNYTEYNNI